MKNKKITKKLLRKLEKRRIKLEFLNWSLKVKERDDYKCVICNSNKLIHSHHILPREIKESRFDINNGITLCPKHHKFSLEISPHRNPLVFILWLQEHRKKQLTELYTKYDINFSIRNVYTIEYKSI